MLYAYFFSFLSPISHTELQNNLSIMLLFLLSNILVAFANSTTVIATTTSVTAMTSTAVTTTIGTANSTTSSPGSCPVTYAPTPTWVSYNTTTDCAVELYGTTLYYDYLDPCVKTYCENMWNRSASSYEAFRQPKECAFSVAHEPFHTSTSLLLRLISLRDG